MRGQAADIKSVPILVDRRASTFGSLGAALRLRPGFRETGVLTLYEDRLVYEPAAGERVAIAMEEVERLGVGLWQGIRTRGVPVLKITYRKNLMFGVVVARPDRWINAVDTLTAGRPRPPSIDQRAVPRNEVRTFRVAVASILLLVILLGVVLPILFTRFHDRTVREIQRERTPAAGPTGTGG